MENIKPNFIDDITARFRDGLIDMLAERSDTFSFEFPLSEVPGWEVRAEAEKAGMRADTLMTLVVLIRPKAMADPMLEAMAAARGGVEVVEG